MTSFVVAFVSSMICCYAIIRVVLAWPKNAHLTQPIRAVGPQSHLVDKANTPTLGGVAIMCGLLAGINITSLLTDNSWISQELWIAIYAALGFAGVGLTDDVLKLARKSNDGLSVNGKLIAQFTVGAMLLVIVQDQFGAPAYIDAWNIPHPLWWTFNILGIVLTVNAVNLTDGLDGLVTPPAIFTLLALTISAGILYGTGNNPTWDGTTIVALSMTGSLVAFLHFNQYPARIFMGDVGSMAIGGLLVALAMQWHLQFILVIAGLLFFLEAASVILQVGYFKLTKGKKLFLMAPFHHHLELLGTYTEQQVVQRLWVLSLVSACVAISVSWWWGNSV